MTEDQKNIIDRGIHKTLGKIPDKAGYEKHIRDVKEDIDKTKIKH